MSCGKCGYALYRTSTRSSARAIHYYRCLGSDAWRRLSGSVCTNRPVRQDLLHEVVWSEVVRLLEDPSLIQNEIDRRLEAAREADPTKRREDTLRRDLARIHKSIDRLLTAYQEGLLSLDELRERMPNLRRREQADNAELQAIVDQSADRAAYLRLAETLTTFLARLRSSADVLDISERQRVVRLLVKDILVDDDKIIMRHSIPLGNGNVSPPAQSAPRVPNAESYLLRSRSQRTALRGPFHAWTDQPVLHHSGIQKCPDESQQPLVLDAFGNLRHQFVVIDPIKEFFQIEINHPSVACRDILLSVSHGLMRRPSRSEPIACGENVGSHRLCRTCITACWIKRSSTAGTHSSNCTPFQPTFGIG